MADWIAIPSFTDNTIVRAPVWRDIWANLYNLKNGECEVQQMPGAAGDLWSNASPFADIDSVYYNMTYMSHGGDLLILANLKAYTNAVSTRCYFRLMLDGVAIGNTNGLYEKIGQNFESFQLSYIIRNVAAGQHVIKVQHRNSLNTPNVSQVRKDPIQEFIIMELN